MLKSSSAYLLILAALLHHGLAVPTHPGWLAMILNPDVTQSTPTGQHHSPHGQLDGQAVHLPQANQHGPAAPHGQSGQSVYQHQSANHPQAHQQHDPPPPHDQSGQSQSAYHSQAHQHEPPYQHTSAPGQHLPSHRGPSPPQGHPSDHTGSSVQGSQGGNRASANSANCPVCHKSFATAYNMRVHHKNHYADGKLKYECYECPRHREFPDGNTLDWHHKHWHSGGM